MGSRGQVSIDTRINISSRPPRSFRMLIAGLDIEIRDLRSEPKLHTELAYLADAVPCKASNFDDGGVGSTAEPPSQTVRHQDSNIPAHPAVTGSSGLASETREMYRLPRHVTLSIVDEAPQDYQDPACLASAPRGERRPRSTDDRVWNRPQDDALDLAGFDFGGRHSRSTSTAIFWLHQPSRLPAGARIEYFIRLLVALEVFDAGGILLHAAGIRLGTLGHVFLGPSGSGKTTLAGHLDADQVLNDDLIVVQPDKRGHWQVHPTPFHNPTQVKGAWQAPVRLAGLYRLRQAKGNRLVPQPSAVAIAEIMACTPIICQDPTRKAMLFGRAEALAGALPAFYDLHLVPDRSVWELFNA